MPVKTIICKLDAHQCHSLLNRTSQSNPTCSDVTALRGTVRYVFMAQEISANDIREVYSNVC